MTSRTDATSCGSDTRSAVLVIDLVESVRLLQNQESRAIERWERLIALLRAQLLPQHRGQLVKSLGDGAMLTFSRTDDALALAAALLDSTASLNEGLREEHWLTLRLALHATDWVAGELDIYGPGVNLCARLLGLAQPQCLVMSAETLAMLGTPPPPWQLQALGTCHLKHIEVPVACVQCRRSHLPVLGLASAQDLRPTLAVLPLELASDAQLPAGASAVLRDDLVRALARHRAWRVVSRLSTQAFTEAHELSTAGAPAHLWLRGRLDGDTQGAVLDLSFLEGEQELWSGHFEMGWGKLLDAEGGLAQRVAAALDQALLRQGASAGYQPALPTVPSYALLLRALQSMHRLRADAVQQAGDMLEHLAERHPRASDVQAWLSKLQFIRLCQGLTAEPQRTVEQARQAAQQALQREPGNCVALAVLGQLRAFHDGDAGGAYSALGQASQQAPNEMLIWMYLTNLQAVREERCALQSFQTALSLSPLDPLGYELDLMGAIAHSAVGERGEALRLARRSVARNPHHLSSRVQLIIALVECDELEEARQHAAAYVSSRPQASVRRFAEQHFGAGTPLVLRHTEALLSAGLPY